MKACKHNITHKLTEWVKREKKIKKKKKIYGAADLICARVHLNETCGIIYWLLCARLYSLKTILLNENIEFSSLVFDTNRMRKGRKKKLYTFRWITSKHTRPINSLWYIYIIFPFCSFLLRFYSTVDHARQSSNKKHFILVFLRHRRKFF